MRALMIVTLGVLAGAGLVACGDDGGGDALTQSEFEDQANAICDEGNDEIDAEANDFFADVPSGEAPSEDDESAFVNDVLVPNVQGQIDDIRDLDAPEDIQDDLNATLDQAEEILDQISDDPSIAFSDEDPFDEINAELDDLGLTSCS
jgi:hypothetical protein